eukprot:11131635-Alexandrium_andersonii.AAC.1
MHITALATDYFRRILGRVRQYPYLLFWLIWKPPSIDCLERRSCARDLINLSDSDIADRTVQKFRRIFGPELQAALESGTISEALHSFLTEVAYRWPMDTQEIEGCNNTLKYIYRHAPYVSWRALSSKVTLRKWIGDYVDSPAVRDAWASRCVDFHKRASCYMKDECIAASSTRRFDM